MQQLPLLSLIRTEEELVPVDVPVQAELVSLMGHILVPVFHGQRLIAWTVNKAHWTEVGGAQAGSVSTQSTEI